ncbi:MAG: TSUP family transporter, partial [Planctomycetaceae bacterium]|nr:TSUP family transporter [Planctomycetaceae bacterium]
VKRVAATSAVFILVNSAAGLTGWIAAGNAFPEIAPRFIVVVIVGGLIGSYLGAFCLSPRIIRRCMAAILVLAGVKLLMHATLSFGLVSEFA